MILLPRKGTLWSPVSRKEKLHKSRKCGPISFSFQLNCFIAEYVEIRRPEWQTRQIKIYEVMPSILRWTDIKKCFNYYIYLFTERVFTKHLTNLTPGCWEILKWAQIWVQMSCLSRKEDDIMMARVKMHKGNLYCDGWGKAEWPEWRLSPPDWPPGRPQDHRQAQRHEGEAGGHWAGPETGQGGTKVPLKSLFHLKMTLIWPEVQSRLCLSVFFLWLLGLACPLLAQS